MRLMDVHIVQFIDWDYNDIDSVWSDYEDAVARAKEVAATSRYGYSAQAMEQRTYVLSVPVNAPAVKVKSVQVSKIVD